MMNITVERFVQGLERSADALPALLDEWDTIDEELQAEYRDQLQWILCKRGEVLVRCKLEGTFDEFGPRIEAADRKIEALLDRIRSVMGTGALP